MWVEEKCKYMWGQSSLCYYTEKQWTHEGKCGACVRKVNVLRMWGDADAPMGLCAEDPIREEDRWKCHSEAGEVNKTGPKNPEVLFHFTYLSYTLSCSLRVRGHFPVIVVITFLRLLSIIRKVCVSPVWWELASVYTLLPWTQKRLLSW